MKKVSGKDLRFAVLAVDAAVFTLAERELLVLVGVVSNPDFAGQKGLVGGIIRADETAEAAVRRHMQDKAGIGNVFFEQLAAFSAVDRDPRGRVVSVAYLGLAAEEPRVSAGTMDTHWVPVRHVKNLAYDHDEILATAVARLRAKLGYTNIAQHLLPQEFTLSELQNVYEIVMGKAFDKRNFRKKVLKTGMVTPVGKTTTKASRRPAALYRFASRQQKTIDIL